MKNLKKFNRKNKDISASPVDDYVHGGRFSVNIPLVYDTQTIVFSFPSKRESEEALGNLYSLILCEDIGTFVGASTKTYNEQGTTQLESEFYPLRKDAKVFNSELDVAPPVSLATQLNSLLGVQPFTLELTSNLKLENVLRVLSCSALEQSHSTHHFLEVACLIVRNTTDDN